MSTFTSADAAPVKQPSSAFAGLGTLPGEADRVRSFWRSVERYPPGVTLHAGTGLSARKVIVSGWASETRILHDGRRQIFSFLLPGDAVDLTRAGSIGRRSVVTLTRLETVDAEVLLNRSDATRETVREAIQTAMRRKEERLFDHMARIGRLTTKERVLNLLLELHDRLEAVGLAKQGSFRIPLTQEVFADTLGLSIVHINRTLQHLRREGLITLKAGTVTLHDRRRLAALCCYQMTGEDAESPRLI